MGMGFLPTILMGIAEIVSGVGFGRHAFAN